MDIGFAFLFYCTPSHNSTDNSNSDSSAWKPMKDQQDKASGHYQMNVSCAKLHDSVCIQREKDATHRNPNSQILRQKETPFANLFIT
jgi:hypothetical protein